MVADEYRAYLLRLWRVANDGDHWRARLENVDSGEAQGFASLDKLIDFLQKLDEDGKLPEEEMDDGLNAG